jgi:putative effector of murein hydrolase LrgA (UPF0299 family)
LNEAHEERTVMLSSLLFLLLIPAAIAVAPVWPLTRKWSWRPLAMVLVAIVVIGFIGMNGWF